ncbi:uncharacterized protein LOC120314269 isoform X2 [Crotalus tigris]|uniref:uncharacterized protein LOC120314269 isoform X2 n=1 Tax=Crotalus tigris TaxID=88082 RepID=UPI00192FA036|nr:uncharacterized protein LOC120314269 isoform X2 [Crotalus tigris]
MGRGKSAPKAEEKRVLAAMSSPWLVLVLVGSASGLVLSTPLFPVSVSHGKTALLPVSLNFSSSVPTYFQIRWRFITGPWLVLIVKADNCGRDNGTHQWWETCEIIVEKTERYRHRAEWSSEDASLILQDVRVEDSGVYEIKLLALGVRVSANINLTVINETSNAHLNAAAFGGQRRGTFPSRSTNVAAPVSLMKAEFGRDYTVPNIIRLTSAGLILCLLGFIIAENVASSYSRQRDTRVNQVEIPFSSSVEQCFLTYENYPI